VRCVRNLSSSWNWSWSSWSKAWLCILFVPAWTVWVDVIYCVLIGCTSHLAGRPQGIVMSSRGGYGRDGGRHRRGGGQFRGGGRHRGGGGRFRGPGRGEGGEEGSKPEGELDWSPPTSAEMLDHGIRSAITDYCNRYSEFYGLVCCIRGLGPCSYTSVLFKCLTALWKHV